ncbi:MAG: hypothetical protein IKI49_00640 [Oscillospiraceae bacterium]|nr:hypothetical protein [Oscillospiraceae bacterium]
MKKQKEDTKEKLNILDTVRKVLVYMRGHRRVTCSFVIIILAAMAFLVASKSYEGRTQSILLSMGTNLIASVIILLLINSSLESYAARVAEGKEKSAERQAILNSDSVIQCILPQYKLLFNQLVTPWNARTKDGTFLPIDNSELKDFTLNDLMDLFKINITVFGAYNECSLETYSVTNSRLVRSFENILIMNSFHHYPAICDAIKAIITISLFPNGIPAMLKIKQCNDANTIELLERMIQSYEGNPIDDLKTQKFKGNLMLNVIHLYFYLQRMKAAIQDYESKILILKYSQE